jgi:hypothetical protein
MSGAEVAVALRPLAEIAGALQPARSVRGARALVALFRLRLAEASVPADVASALAAVQEGNPRASLIPICSQIGREE